MEEFLEFVIKQLVEFPDEMIVTKLEAPRKITFRLRLRQSDVGKVIGNYDPKKPGDNSKIDLSRVEYWIGCGAQPSDTVRSIIKKAKKSAASAA